MKREEGMLEGEVNRMKDMVREKMEEIEKIKKEMQ